MFFWFARTFFNKICSCSVNPLLIFLLCLEVSNCPNSFNVSFFNSSRFFPLYVNSFFAIFTFFLFFLVQSFQLFAQAESFLLIELEFLLRASFFHQMDGSASSLMFR